MASIDYVNLDHDLLIENGDFVKGDCQQQHIDNIVSSSKGSYKQFPLVGVDLFKYVNSPLSAATKISLNKQIRLQLQGDGYDIISVDTNDFENIKIEAVK
jgi:hypothetical protein